MDGPYAPNYPLFNYNHTLCTRIKRDALGIGDIICSFLWVREWLLICYDDAGEKFNTLMEPDRGKI